MPRRVRIAVFAVLLVGASVAAYVGIEHQREQDELRRRYDCPEEHSEPLPTAGEVAHESDRFRLVQEGTFEPLTSVAFHPQTGQPYVTERAGRVLRLGPADPAEVIDLTDRVTSDGERGLFDLVFSPDGSWLYLHHTDADGHSNVVAYPLDGGGMPSGDPEQVLFVEQPHEWHNAGDLELDDDGLLYVTLGDGGGRADPWDTGQDLSEPLGSILRIEPRPGTEEGHAVPDDNPFVDREDADPRIWAYGLRNPWRIDVDGSTVVITDAGDGCFEEVDVVSIDDAGANFGWDRVEGPWVVDPPAPEDHVPPVFTYDSRLEGTCTIIGGFVYRGAALPDLVGRYLFTDLCRGEVVAMDTETGAVEPLGVGSPTLTGFGQDLDGEPWLVTLSGDVYRMEPASP